MNTIYLNRTLFIHLYSVFFTASLFSQNVKLIYSEEFITTLDSVSIFCRIIGESKDTLVVFHGGGFGSSYLIPDLTPLASHHTLIFFDQPGTGFSSVVKDTARLSMNRFVSDVEVVRKHFKLKKMNILAHSNGGLMSGYYATIYPNHIESLILVNPTSASLRWSNLNRFDSTSLLLLKQNKKMYNSSPSDTIKACWDYYSIWARGKFPSSKHARRIWGDVCHCNQENLLNPYLYYPLLSLGQWDLTKPLNKVKARTLIIGGDMDETPVSAWEEWKVSIPNSKLLIIQGAGHLPYVDKPNIFFIAVENFLNSKKVNLTDFNVNGAGVILSGDATGTPYQRSRASIIQLENELVQLLNSANWDKASKMYTKDASLFAPGAPPIQGQRAIASFWQTVSSRGMKSIELQLIDVRINGQQLTAKGKYVMYDKNNDILDIGKFIALYLKEHNTWRLNTDIFNSSMETRSPIEVPDYLKLQNN